MFKFKALIAPKGNYFYGERFVPYKNSEVITGDKKEAEYLRRNRGFEEVLEEKTKPTEEKEAELKELKAKATELGVQFSVNIGSDTLKKRIEEKEAELEGAE